MPEKDLIIENLKTLRALENLTVDQFAERINAPKHNVVKYLSRSMPPHDVIRAIAKSFDLDVHQLYFKKLTKFNYQDFQRTGDFRPNYTQSKEPTDEIREALEILSDKNQSKENRQQAEERIIELNGQLTAEINELRQMYKDLMSFLQKNKIINKLEG